jgi:hypothetical protein
MTYSMTDFSIQTTNSTVAQTGGFRLRPGVFVALLLLLAPLGYIAGRISTPVLAGTYFEFLTSGVVATTLGVMIGLPFGLFFGTLRTPRLASPVVHTPAGNTVQMETDILAEIKTELEENKALFEARKGSTTVVARLEYVTTFWDAAKASGRLFVMQNARLMSTIALAYYWLAQANHLEKLAYDAKNSGQVEDSQFTTARLISEVRLLDASLESALNAAIDAINTQVAKRT